MMMKSLRLVCVFFLAVIHWLPAATTEVLVLQTADIHGAVGTPCSEEQGDWLTLASVIREMRRAHGRERTLLIDCGDTCQGSLIATQTQGGVIVPLLQSLEYDVWVPGNHELDFGSRRLLDLCQAEDMPTVCGNLELVMDGNTHRFPGWRMFERGGARIAVIGATASYMRHWFIPEGKDLRFRVWEAKRLLEDLLPQIMDQQPDAIILAAHQGWLTRDPRGVNELREIADWFPEIDLILGGHTHRIMPGIAVGPETWYVQPGAHATHVGAIRMLIDTEAHRVVDIRSELIPCGARVDAVARDAVADMLAAARLAAAHRICTLPADIKSRGTPGVSCATSELICRALAAESGAVWVLHGRLSRADLPAGPVTEGMLFELVPYENSLVAADVTPDELEVMVTEQLETRHSYVYCGVWGAHFQIHPPKPEGGRLRPYVTMTNKPQGTRRQTIVMNSYTAAGGGGRFPELRRIVDQPQARRRVVAVSTRDVVREYLREHADTPVSAHRWIRGTLSTFDK